MSEGEGCYATVAVEQRCRRDKGLVVTALYQTGPKGSLGNATPPLPISLAHTPPSTVISSSYLCSLAAGRLPSRAISPWGACSHSYARREKDRRWKGGGTLG